MSDQDDLQIESALRAYLGRELDGQLGRAKACFLREIEASAPIPINAATAAPTRSIGGAGRRARLWWAPLAGGIAAAVGIACGVAEFHPWKTTPKSPVVDNTPHNATPSTQLAVAPEPSDSETIVVQTIDEGTVVVGDQGPARQLRREVIDHVEWFDPTTNKRIQIDIPREEVVLVGMNAY